MNKVIRSYDSKFFKGKDGADTGKMADDFRLHPRYDVDKNYIIQKQKPENDRDTFYDVIELEIPSVNNITY